MPRFTKVLRRSENRFEMPMAMALELPMLVDEAKVTAKIGLSTFCALGFAMLALASPAQASSLDTAVARLQAHVARGRNLDDADVEEAQVLLNRIVESRRRDLVPILVELVDFVHPFGICPDQEIRQTLELRFATAALLVDAEQLVNLLGNLLEERRLYGREAYSLLVGLAATGTPALRPLFVRGLESSVRKGSGDYSCLDALVKLRGFPEEEPYFRDLIKRFPGSRDALLAELALTYGKGVAQFLVTFVDPKQPIASQDGLLNALVLTADPAVEPVLVRALHQHRDLQPETRKHVLGYLWTHGSTPRISNRASAILAREQEKEDHRWQRTENAPSLLRASVPLALVALFGIAQCRCWRKWAVPCKSRGPLSVLGGAVLGGGLFFLAVRLMTGHFPGFVMPGRSGNVGIGGAVEAANMVLFVGLWLMIALAAGVGAISGGLARKHFRAFRAIGLLNVVWPIVAIIVLWI
jgi:hypothetical protein